MVEAERRVVAAQLGPQFDFLATPADIAIYGGAAGGGKTWALLLEPLRHSRNPDFGAVIFRRTTVQVRNEGGLWDESGKLYPLVGASPREHVLEWRFPSGASVSFAHLEHEKNVNDWQGSQIPLICFDELTHFSQKQFWYMVSRNRSMCGVKPYIRATCNPDADSWVADFIAWWIDQETGLADPSRAGVLRWFVRANDKLIWADRPEDLAEHVSPTTGRPLPALSVTFVPAKLSDNRALMAANPEYEANLLALPKVERERLLGGNWKIRAAAGLLFKRAWCQVVEAAPAGLKTVRGWDLAATPKTESNDPDWTAGTKIGRSADGRYFVLDHRRDRATPSGVERMIANTATEDGVGVEISLPQDPGQAGKSQIAALVRVLEGYTARSSPETGDKVTRFGPFSAQAEAGNVYVLRGPWNEEWFAALEAFPDAAHDDDADSTARAFNAHIQMAAYSGFADLIRAENAAQASARATTPSVERPLVFVMPAGTDGIEMAGGETVYEPDAARRFSARAEHRPALEALGCRLVS